MLELKIHVRGAQPYPISDDQFDWSLEDAIREEAEAIAADAGAELLAEPTDEERDALRSRIVQEMGAALNAPGDKYRAPDGTRYSLREVPDED